MKAVTYQGPKKVEVKNVDDPMIEKKDDIIVRITSTAICGSDLHLYQGNMKLREDYIIGHEPMGIVEEVGPEVTKVKKGDRVIIPFTVACGRCIYCQNEMESQCDYLILLKIPEDIWATLKCMAIIQEDKRSF